MSPRLAAALAFAASALLSLPAAAQLVFAITEGVAYQATPKEIREKFEPLAEVIGKALRREVRIVLVPDAAVSHHRPSGPSQLWRQYVEYGRGARRLDRNRAGEGLQPVRAGRGFPRALARSTLGAARDARSPLVVPLVGLTQVATAWGYATLGPSSPA